MAIMIPQIPRESEKNSHEEDIFFALESLPDSYYVIHSHKHVSEGANHNIKESETDFIIFNPQKGILLIESKAGKIKCEDGVWRYSNGDLMSNDGPFRQASKNKWDLFKQIKEGKMSDIVNRCKFLTAVWFPTVDNNYIFKQTIPSEIDKVQIFTMSDFGNPLEHIDKLFEYNDTAQGRKVTKTNLTSSEEKYLIERVFCPNFEIVPTASLKIDLDRIRFHRLHKEQINLLNYLEEQKTAVINGAAGTGKTMIALEKAKRHAFDEEKVLFLCYNSKLKNHLSEDNPEPFIDFFTIDGLACKICNTASPDYDRLKDELTIQFVNGTFPYKHIIIDEGQDFGQDNMEEADIISTLKMIVTDETIDGTFYVFYDKMQHVQGKKIPEFIIDADCKLTLYKNSRNTENIAITSLRPITERKPKLGENTIEGTTPKMYYRTKEMPLDKCVDSAINDMKSEGVNNIVILTTKTEESSGFSSFCNDGIFRAKYPFTTCRKFKGLEADGIILIDVDKSALCGENTLLYYVGTSRARFKLSLISPLSESECIEVLNQLKPEANTRKPKVALTAALNCIQKSLAV